MAKVKESTKYEGLLGVKEGLSSLEEFVVAHVPDPKDDPKNPNNASKHWVAMPASKNVDKSAYKSIIINFKDKASIKAFEVATGITITDKTKSSWFPKEVAEDNSLNRWIQETE